MVMSRFNANGPVSDIRGELFISRTEMRIGKSNPTTIKFRRRPTPQQTNVIYILGEYPNRIVEIDTLCDRLGVGLVVLQTYISKLRTKCLINEDWAIEKLTHKGYRLIDLRDK